MSNIDKDREILKEFIEYSQNMINDMEYEKPVDVTINQEEVTAIETILKKLEETQKEVKAKEETDKIINKIKSELKTRNKIINLMAQELIDMPIKIMLGHVSFEYRNKEDTIEHFRNEVLKDEN